ncbi:MAG: hypothetical protein AAFQ61_11375 [Cyanobacteria bacterium J06626_23]
MVTALTLLTPALLLLEKLLTPVLPIPVRLTPAPLTPVLPIPVRLTPVRLTPVLAAS